MIPTTNPPDAKDDHPWCRALGIQVPALESVVDHPESIPLRHSSAQYGSWFKLGNRKAFPAGQRGPHARWCNARGLE
jgi:hypothetical protein